MSRNVQSSAIMKTKLGLAVFPEPYEILLIPAKAPATAIFKNSRLFIESFLSSNIVANPPPAVRFWQAGVHSLIINCLTFSFNSHDTVDSEKIVAPIRS